LADGDRDGDGDADADADVDGGGGDKDNVVVEQRHAWVLPEVLRCIFSRGLGGRTQCIVLGGVNFLCK